MVEIIDKYAQGVEGKKDNNVTLVTLSTCMWCKKCKRFLQDKDMKYQYVDVDKIPPEDKVKILNYLKENYQSRISYPFLICDNGHVVGYDPKKYEELMMDGEK
ncbi:MAG: glutaredoxin family protein [Promethearchaeota archaeon]